MEALRTFNSEELSYGSIQLRAEFIPTLDWRSAICGLHANGSCRQEDECNFLHLLTNPSHDDDGSEGEQQRSSRHRSHSGRYGGRKEEEGHTQR